MTTTATITADTQLNDLVRLHPGTLPVLNAAGLDTCCGGALPLAEAARRHGIEPDLLLAELRRVAADAAAEEREPA